MSFSIGVETESEYKYSGLDMIFVRRIGRKLWRVRAANVVSLALVLASPLCAHSDAFIDGGSTGCGLWIKARKTNSAVALEHWTVGTLNGMAWGSSRDFWRPKGRVLGRESVFLWLDNYCTSHPAEDLFQGIVELFLEQTGRK